MWRQFRRRSMAPRRPVLFECQYSLALVTAIVVVGSVVLVGWAVLD